MAAPKEYIVFWQNRNNPSVYGQGRPMTRELADAWASKGSTKDIATTVVWIGSKGEGYKYVPDNFLKGLREHA